jgi:hypothetical protein
VDLDRNIQLVHARRPAQACKYWLLGIVYTCAFYQEDLPLCDISILSTRKSSSLHVACYPFHNFCIDNISLEPKFYGSLAERFAYRLKRKKYYMSYKAGFNTFPIEYDAEYRRLDWILSTLLVSTN